MKTFYILIIIALFSCKEEKPQELKEENTYYTKYLEIYNSYDSLGAEKSIVSLDAYLTEFPNSVDAYIFKAWILANNNKINEIDALFQKAVSYDSSNTKTYNYWTSLLLKDSNNINKAKEKNSLGLKLDENNLELKNNLSWIYLFEKQHSKALENSINILETDTNNNHKYFRSTAVMALATENDSLYSFYIEKAKQNGLKSELDIKAFLKETNSFFKLYNQLK